MKKLLFFIALVAPLLFCGFLQALENEKKDVQKIVVEKRYNKNQRPSVKEEARSLFLSGKLSEFDPLVGEHQCQIRVLMFIELFLKAQKGQKLSESDCDFLEKCLILTRYKDASAVDAFGNGSQAIDRDKAKKDGFSRSFIEETCKPHLCAMSIEFLQKKAHELQDAALIELFTHVRSNGSGLKTVACFPGLKVIMHSLLQHSIPLAFKLFVRIESDSQEKVLTICDAMSQQSENIPVFVVEGFARVPDMQSFNILLQRFFTLNRHTMNDIMLLNAAVHPQYAGKKTEQALPENSITSALCVEYQTARLRAIKEGCALTNPTFFVVRHILCHSFKEFLEKNTDSVFLHNKTI